MRRPENVATPNFFPSENLRGRKEEGKKVQELQIKREETFEKGPAKKEERQL